MTTTDHAAAQLATMRRFHAARTNPTDGNRAFAIELLSSNNKDARQQMLAAREAQDKAMAAYHTGRADAIAVILVTLVEDGPQAAIDAAYTIATATAAAPADSMRMHGAHDAASLAITLLSVYR